MRTLRALLAVVMVSTAIGVLPVTTMAQSEAASETPVYVSGHIESFEVVDQEAASSTEGRVRNPRNVYRLEQSSADPRLAGIWTAELTFDELSSADAGAVFTGYVTLENDAGSWHGTVTGFQAPAAPGQVLQQTELVGQGGYEGLSALLYHSGEYGVSEFEGLLFEGRMPPMPPSGE